MFTLDPRLEADTVLVEHLTLSDLRLMNDANYPWLLLIPRIADVTEVYHLSLADQCQLLKESNAVSRLMSIHYAAHKMNIAALGNQVSQLHLHHIARYEGDPAWPNPVWGFQPAVPYTEEELEVTLTSLKAVIAAHREEVNGLTEGNPSKEKGEG